MNLLVVEAEEHNHSAWALVDSQGMRWEVEEDPEVVHPGEGLEEDAAVAEVALVGVPDQVRLDLGLP